MGLKSKKGSSLIAVVLIFAVLSISGISILSLTVYDYNARITASKKVQSLYASDSGINAVYGIMKKVTSQGTLKGNKAVNDYMKTFDGSLDTDALKLKLNSIFKESYRESISSYILNNITSPNEYLKNGSCVDLDGNAISINNIIDATNPPIITVKLNLAKSSPVIANKWVLNITSQFATTPISGQTSNKKTVQADIAIGIPEYQNSYFVETKKQEIAINPVWKNAISIDGDMHINSDITVDGDIFVMGKPPEVTDEKVYTKYNGGISIGSDDTNTIKAIFNKNVVTSNSFNISGQNKEVIVAGNIYAGNVYIGKSGSSVETASSDCTLTVNDKSSSKGSVYTSNDLALYATKSHINIDKYYGINDIGGERTVDKDYNSSSSIIVNTDDIGTKDGSSINIGDAIINGTAYINTSTPYQTGESVAVKGNYRAYTIPIPKSTGTVSDGSNAYDEDKVDFVYNAPLQLVDSFKESTDKLTGAHKSEYFRKIYEKKLSELKSAEITIDNVIFSAGVALSNGGIITKSIDISKTDVIESKQNVFARLVYEMGDITNVGVPKLADEAKMLNDDYLTGKVNKAVFDGDWIAKRDEKGYLVDKIAQVTLSNVDNSNSVDKANSEVEVRAENKNVVILGKNSTYISDPVKDEVVDLSTMEGDPHGIIITSGDVTLSGEVDFTGTIIAGGDLTTINDGLKTLTYDDNYVLKTIARDYTNTYSKVFNIIKGMNTQIVEVAATVGGNANAASNGIDGGVVKLSNWRVNN